MITEIQIDQNFIDLFRELIHDKLGIYISKEKDYLIQSKLSRLISKSDYKNINEFYYSLKKNNKESIEDLIKHITTTHTFFFRESMHLKILRNDILIKKIENPLIWCAATSTGEEVYSIIIELLENNINNFFIVASDINKDVLIHLKKGIYSKERIKNVSRDLFNKYFDKYTDGAFVRYKIKSYLKKYFIVKKINLIEDVLFEKKFDYIFCRNVLIYFNKKTQKEVIDNLLNNLSDFGYLFVGHSETLFSITNKVESVFSSVYNKVNR